MRRCARTLAPVMLAAAILLCASPARAALPPTQPDDTSMLDGKVRALAQAGGHIWIGGSFTQSLDAAGKSPVAVNSLVALDPDTGLLDPSVHQPDVTNGGAAATVYDLALGPDGNLYFAGRFSSVNGQARKNVAAIDPTTGNLLAFDPRTAEATSIYATNTNVYVGTDRVLSFEFNGTASAGFTPPQVFVDQSIRGGHTTPPQIRDITQVGDHLLAACQCDSLSDTNGTRNVKAIVKIDPASGDWMNWRPSNLPDDSGAFGISLLVHDPPGGGPLTVYLAAGGSDFTAAYNEATGQQRWKTDTSGSSQAVTWYQGNLIVGGHFNWTQTPTSDTCGANDTPNLDCYHSPKLVAMDPDTGRVILDGTAPWNPGICCSYNGIWALLTDADGSHLHIGGEFQRVGGTWSGSGIDWTLSGWTKQQYYARFTGPVLGQEQLTVSRAGSGGGAVTSTPEGIDCGTTCSANFAQGTSVTLTPLAGPNSVFKGWGGDCSGTGACQVTMDATRNVSANFVPAVPLTVTLVGTGGGTVTSNPAGIECGAVCDATYPGDTVVTLTAAPGPNSTFAGWGGDCSGTGTCKITLADPGSVTATFNKIVVPKCGSIAFVSARRGDGDIFVMDADGSGVLDVTNDPAPDRDPSWSPGCGQIAFSSSRNGDGDIFVMDADGTSVKALTSGAGNDTQPTWSPDGSKVAFTSDRTGNRELFVMDADGKHQTQITDNAWVDQQPDWSPDGTKLVFASNRDDVMQVFTIWPDGTHLKQITSGLKANDQPTWSPDGSRIAFVSRSSGTPQIWIVNAKGGGRVRVSTGDKSDSHPSWSPNGMRLTYASNVSGVRQIWTITTGGKSATKLTKNPAGSTGPSWS
jgi:Tol biopolymer transport system component